MHMTTPRKKSTMKSFRSIPRQGLSSLGIACAAMLSACGGGSGSSAPLVPEAVVTAVANASVVEGNNGTKQIDFVVILDKPVERSLVVDFRTLSTAKAGVSSTGSATGGATCSAPGADYVSASAGKVTLPAGAKSGIVSVTVCGDTVFEPTETFKLVWSSAGSDGGTAIGTIVNDDANGILGGTGSTTLLGGQAAFGRDTDPLTNSDADGPLGFSFTNRQHTLNCTQDLVSGLTWQSPLQTATMTYAALSATVASVNVQTPCGYSDWRLPKANELLSLMNASIKSGRAPNADSTGSADAMSGRYWTGEAMAAPSLNAWYLDASNGGAISLATKTDTNAVRLVRGSAISAQCDNADKRFTQFADGTVQDNASGLMWKQCPEGSSGNTCSVGSASAFTSAAQLIAQVKAANVKGTAAGLGYADWRIPTRNEMASLLGRNCTGNLAAPASIIPINGTLNFATATLDADAPTTRLWSVNFQDGSIGQTVMSAPMHLRLVRAGQ
jgi:hypothetical protein